MVENEVAVRCLFVGASEEVVGRLEKSLESAQKGRFRIARAETVDAAQTILDSHPRTFLFVELCENGSEKTLQWLKKIGSESPLILVFKEDTESTLKAALDEGIHDFLSFEQLSADNVLRAMRQAWRCFDLQRRLSFSQTNATQMSEALIASEERLRVLLAHYPGMFWMADSALKMKSCLGDSLGHFNLAPNAAVGQSIGEFLSNASNKDELISAHQKALSGQIVKCELELEGYFFDLVIEPVRNDRGDVQSVVGLALDVSERKALERQVIASQQMETVGRLGLGFAHDFNNLLTVILNYAQMAQEDEGQKNPDLLQKMNAVVNCAKKASTLTGQLLTYGRQHRQTPQILSLNSTLATLEPMLKRTLGSSITVQMHLSEAKLPVNLEPQNLIHVVLKLLVRAKDALGTGGEINLRTSKVQLEDSAAQKLQTPAGAYAKLTVKDHGELLDAPAITRIFQGFSASDEADSKSLGLSTIASLVKKAGGQLEIESTADQGTSFHVYLPLAKEIESASAVAAQSKTLGTILVVEDEDVVRQVACDIIKKQGYNVIEAPDAIAALKILDQSDKKIDLVLSDLIMPKMTGPELVRNLVAKHPELRVIYMSGYNDDAFSHNEALKSKEGFVQKPFAPKSLLTAIASALSG